MNSKTLRPRPGEYDDGLARGRYGYALCDASTHGPTRHFMLKSEGSRRGAKTRPLQNGGESFYSIGVGSFYVVKAKMYYQQQQSRLVEAGLN